MTDRYWWVCGPEGWTVETWRGPACAENVVTVGRVVSLDDADAFVRELNGQPVMPAKNEATR